MSIKITDNQNAIIFENSFVKFEVSEKDAEVLSIVDKRLGKSIMAKEKTFFFAHLDGDKKPFKNRGVSIDGDRVVFESEKGKSEFSVSIAENYFVFETVSEKLPEGVDAVRFAHALFDYDFNEEGVLVAAGVPMTVNTKTEAFPTGLDKELQASAYDRLGGIKGARYGFTVITRDALRDALKAICSVIDPEKGLVSRNAGPWARDSRVGFGSYIIEGNAHPDHVRESIPFWKTLGVDQIDFHHCRYTFHQGTFVFPNAKDVYDFKKTVTDVLKENGLGAGLHTYAFYISPFGKEILSDPYWQKQLLSGEEYFLAEDITSETDYILADASTEDMDTYYGFFNRNIPFILIGEEIVKFENAPDGFKVIERGACGTRAVSHKKGEKVTHLLGYFNLFAPKLDSELFYKIAHNTADAYNKGGFEMIYQDAIDGMVKTYGISRDDRWYYCARFIHEIVKNCNTPPIIEYSDMPCSLWAGRARTGACDFPYRAYRQFNKQHHESLQKNGVLNHYACTMGWYNYYPTTDYYPGNQHTKYQHFDAIDHMGALSVIYDYSTVFNGTNPSDIPRIRALRRNIEHYNMYADLRRRFYFSEKTLEKLRQNPEQEYKIIKKGDDEYVFVEKDYQTKRLYSLNEADRNTAEFENPYKKQTPFVRVEHCMSTRGDEPMVFLPMNENSPVAAQVKTHAFGGEINVSDKLAMKVRVKGNGRRGAVGIKTRCATNSDAGYGLYIIETDFEGWREFVLLEGEAGEHPEYSFDAMPKENLYGIYRCGLHMGRITQVELETDGDVEGVLMSSVVACRHTYNVWKNPTVKIGDESVMFECELMSTDFIEYDGESAKVIDRYGNEKPVWFTGNITAKKGKNKVSLSGTSLNACPINAYLTLGFTGREIK